MIEPRVYVRNAYVSPVQRPVAPGVRGHIQPTQNTSLADIPVSRAPTVYPSPLVVDNAVLGAQETRSTRPSQSHDVFSAPFPSRDPRTFAHAPASSAVADHNTHNPPASTPQSAAARAPMAHSPQLPEFTRAQQAYSGAGAQDGRVFATSSPGETFYTGSRRTVDIIA